MATNTLFATTGSIEAIVEHEIRRKAYQIYERHGRRDGHVLDDWLQAEIEVRKKGADLVPPTKRVLYR